MFQQLKLQETTNLLRHLCQACMILVLDRALMKIMTKVYLRYLLILSKTGIVKKTQDQMLLLTDIKLFQLFQYQIDSTIFNFLGNLVEELEILLMIDSSSHKHRVLQKCSETTHLQNWLKSRTRLQKKQIIILSKIFMMVCWQVNTNSLTFQKELKMETSYTKISLS